MGREWKPGDVGVNIHHGYRGIYVADWCRAHERQGCWHNESGLSDPPSDERRPLVVIDPEDREQVERLNDLYWDTVDTQTAQSDMQAALREFAKPTPPRPDEPQGLGAVVEDADGVRHVRTFSGPPSSRVWLGHIRTDGGDQTRSYDEIAAVRVLSEGVTDE